jgi:hypothetical protein
LHKKRAEVYTKTEATELKEPDDKHSWKKERKKERTRYTTKTTTIRAAAVCRVLKTQQQKKKTTYPEAGQQKNKLGLKNTRGEAYRTRER